MDEDIPLPFDLPGAELKQAQCRVSGLQAVNDRFRMVDLTGPDKSGMTHFHPFEPIPRGSANGR
jgi:hypothetical protein